MKLYSQRDPKWAAVKLGKTQFPIGRYGCTITDIAMLSSYFASIKFGKSNNPAFFANALSFTSEGYLIWESLPKVSAMRMTKRFKKEEMSNLNMNKLILAALINPKSAALIQVNGNHWVLATGTVKDQNGNIKTGEYQIADPFFGDRSTTARYGNKITGGAIISV